MPPPQKIQKISVLHLAAADSMLFPNLRDQLKFLRDKGFDVHTASIDGPLAKRLREEDKFPFTPLPLTRSTAPLSDWKAVKFIETLCREKNFTIVHTHTPKGNVVGQWAARRAKVPIVIQTLHGFYFHENMAWAARKMWINVEKFSAKHSDHVLCQNPEDVETAIKERIVARDRITLLGNGIDLTKYIPVEDDDPRRLRMRKKLGIPTDALVVGMAGRFVKEKGFPEFLAAAKLVFAKFPNSYFLAIGHKLGSERPGDEWEPPEKWLNGHFMSLTDRNDMPDIYCAMDVNVLASHREGFPRVLMEGAAAGLAQVATHIRGCRQCIDEGATGSFFDVGDIQALADRISLLLSDPALRRRQGDAGRNKALKEFNQIQVFEKVLACYAQQLSRRGYRLPYAGSARK